MKITIQNLDLNKAGFTIIDVHPEVAAIRGHGLQILATRGDSCVKVDAPEFLIRGFINKLDALNISRQVEA